MTRLFADSFYFFAVLNANDEAHQKSLEYATPAAPHALQIRCMPPRHRPGPWCIPSRGQPPGSP